MLKKFSFYFAILWLTVFTQSVKANTCSDQTVRIESAADVSAFAARSCTVLTGQLIITGLSESVSLSPLSGLEEIGGGLYIYNNTGGPTSLAGFDDLRSVGGLINLSNNSVLADSSALSNLVSVGGNLYISRNPKLAKIDGLGAVAQIDGTFTVEGPVEQITSMPSLTYVEYGIKIEDTKLINLDWLVGLTKINNNLNIRNNSNLESVSGLSNLSEITGSLLVSGNSSLKTLYGLDGLSIVGGQVSNNGIVNVVVNRSLSDCTSLRGVLGYPDSNDSVAGSIQLSDNLTGCNSQEQVFADHVTIDIQIEGSGRSSPPDQISVPLGGGVSIELFPTSGSVEIKPETTCPGSLQDLMFTVTEATTDCLLNLKYLSQQAADADSDGIPDSIDNCVDVPNSNQTDTDSDGLGNACDDDDDGDGTPDEFDEVPLDSSETVDSDDDGVGDNSDNCPAIANEDQLDTDSDGAGDECDVDDDGDGVADADDAFPLDANESVDTDGDGIGDNSDLYPADPTNNPDSDEDEIDGPEDNCPSDYNPYQLDRDGDGIGDACDIEVLSPGQVNSGQIKTTFSTEAHIYSIELNTSADLEVVVKGLDYLDNITYVIRDEQDNTLGGNNFNVFETSGGETDTRNISVTSGGTYLITITGDYQTNYEVSYTSSEPSGTYEIEPNSSLNNATQIPVGGMRVGHFWPEDSDVDTYYLLSTTPTKLNLTMTATGNYSPFSAEILDVNGNLIDEVDFNFPDNGVGLVSLAASERTYIRLINFNQREEYTVSISLADTDEDGVPDDTDNCSDIYNPNQDDFDSDGAGDLCDTDDDNDGVADTEDAFPLDATEDKDTDSDGLGNNADLDDDNDGLSDEVETEYGTDPLSASDYPVTLETEDNSDIETADAFTAGIPMVGSLYSYEDIDVFEFSVDEAVDLTIDIRKPSDSDSIRYIVVDSDPNLLAGGVLGFPRSETRTVGIIEPGTYFVAVGGNGLLSTSNEEYEIRLTTAPFSGSFEVEPNDDGLTAKRISNGVPVYGHLANEDDIDVFTFEVTWQADLELKIDKLTNYSDRIKYLVRDGTGATLAGGDLFGSEAVTKRIGLAGVGSYYIEIYNNDLLSVSLEEYGILASWTEPTDADSDGDGVVDSEDNCPNQFNSSQSDYDGDDLGDACDLDDDNDTVPDLQDAFPFDISESLDTDQDGVGNNADTDDDGDGVEDSEDAFPLDPTESVDTDGDGVGNNADTDDDNDGVNDSNDAFPLDGTESLDTDNDGIGNNTDTDDDGDGYSDSDESLAGTNPLDANSHPETLEEETGGLPIWLYYIITQPEASSK